ncbi:tetratricopeptide repeat protein [Streptomyces sp. NPDC001404]|uniref:tetratricopeptide repeat protein n=1 Tax=Streptomyces sp. NPDC001404 TaxID=3364571 RepID=UPI00367977D7
MWGKSKRGRAKQAGDQARAPAPDCAVNRHGVSLNHTGPATAEGNAIAVSGYVHELNAPRAPQEPARWPHQVGLIPPRAQSFQHRAEADRLRAAMAGGGTKIVGQVLTGLGGVGKTQLAADYALTVLESCDLDVAVWITADSRPALVAGYAQAGIELCRADPNDAEKAAATFLAWLTPKATEDRPCRWLIVLDDLADPDDAQDLWPPASPHGRTLITTRRRDAALTGSDRRLVEVGLFTSDEALAYLANVLDTHGRQEPYDQLTNVARDLGRLPLALSQAAAYIIDAHVSCKYYGEMLASRIKTLRDAAPDRLPDGQTLTVAATWSLSIDRADTLRPCGLARPMLQIASFLSANGIPEVVLTSTPVRTYLTHHRTQPVDASPPVRPDDSPLQDEDARLALRALHRLSLLDHFPQAVQQPVRVHQLVQRATRESIPPTGQDQAARAAADALTTVWPDIERDTVLAQALRANTDALTRCAEDALHKPDTHPVLIIAGQSLGESGQAATARDYFRHLAVQANRRHGPNHSATQTARHNHSTWQGEAGDPGGAARSYERLLCDRERVLGPDHPDTLATRSNLAYWQAQAGNLDAAATAYANLLKNMPREAGPEHTDTILTAWGNLAYLRAITGRTAEAAAAYNKLLKCQVRVQGFDHPGTLTTMGNIADMVGWAGNAAGAVVLYRKLLKPMQQALGPDHPHTLTTRSNLAYWLGKAGETDHAAATYTELLEHQMQVFGPDHPSTLTTCHNLAGLLGEKGDAAGAADAYDKLLELMRRVLHPTILTFSTPGTTWPGGRARQEMQLTPQPTSTTW